MTDPFQDPDAAGPDFIRAFADSMEQRQTDPTMEAIVEAYLDRLSFSADTRCLEVGAGAGAVTRRIAARADPAEVIGYEPSELFVAEARTRAGTASNLRFEVADGADLPEEDGAADYVILHTVLTHTTTPDVLLAEAFRVLKPGGQLVVCDVDFSKASFASFQNDPLDVCAKAFVEIFVTDPHLVGKVSGLMQEAGFTIDHFGVQSRVITQARHMLPWVSETVKVMQARGQIGEDLARALEAEHERRVRAGTLYGYQAVATVVGRKPT
ncbi:MAG: methyltransferase domain-containing protein [Pseudomonadota bacterium]